MVRTLLTILTLALLSGCATTPLDIEKAATTTVLVSEVQASAKDHVGKDVRWGGTILTVSNKKDQTTIEILSRPMGKGARPLDKPGIGRFLVEVTGFLDPAEYPSGRDLTVVGTIQRVDEKTIGEFPYRYPVITGTNLHLWPEVVDRDPYLYDPFYGPYYPRWPYRHPYWHPHSLYW